MGLRMTLVAAAALLLATFSLARALASSSHHSQISRSAIQMVNLINQDRRQAGIGPLRLDGPLSRVALSHSRDMARHGNLSHSASDGASPYQRMNRCGIHYRVAGENVGYDYGLTTTEMLRAINTAMLGSPEHRTNILRRSFTHVGIGMAHAGSRLYVTEDFTG